MIRNTLARALFDAGASHSLLSKYFIARLGIPSRVKTDSIRVMLSNGCMLLAGQACDVVVQIGSRDFCLTASVLPISEFDVIFCMDCLVEQHALIDSSPKKSRWARIPSRRRGSRVCEELAGR
ncbi:hypothetical protein KSP40_PGU015942 [Platanthera guangdongensis]|uniref:Peptidase A2 domain-containing protein n=1 Tax=Platanthera guangdongensis TaxID=2320717 RepID=A0ABR2MLD2_9ASPA